MSNRLDIHQIMELLQRGETSRIEAKKGTETGQSVMETVSAFSNEPRLDGGYVVFGVVARKRGGSLFPDEAPYEIVGVPNAEKLQEDFASQCNSMLSSKVRPDISRETVDGKSVVIAYIPEAAKGDKPVYISNRGMQVGGFRRIGPTDQTLSQDDIELFFLDRGGKPYDATPIQGTGIVDIDLAAVRRFRELHGQTRPDSALLRSNDEELLSGVGALAREGSGSSRPLTIAGMIAFGKAASIRTEMPLIRIDYTRVLGRTKPGTVPSDVVIVSETNEALLLSVDFIVSKIMSDVERRHSIGPGDIVRSESSTLPRLVVREALVNAVMHRSYRTKASVQVTRFPDRLEIANPGRSLSQFENPQAGVESECRNPLLADILHDCGLAENRGTGVRRMVQAMKDAGLQPPVFHSDSKRDRFLVRLSLHNLLDEEDLEWLKRFGDFARDGQIARLLIHIRDASLIDNSTVRDLCGVQDTLKAGAILKRLRDRNLLSIQGSGSATFYLPAGELETAVDEWWGIADSVQESQTTQPRGSVQTAAMVETVDQTRSEGSKVTAGGSKVTTEGSKVTAGGSKVTTEGSKVTAGGSKVTDHEGDFRPDKKRVKPAKLEELILAICAGSFVSPEELAQKLQRNEDYLKNSYLNRLVKEKRLVFEFPDQPNHPSQAYRTAVPLEGDPNTP